MRDLFYFITYFSPDLLFISLLYMCSMFREAEFLQIIST